MLHLISLGLSGGDLTLAGLKAGRKCRFLYVENYTAPVPGKSVLEKRFRKRVIPVGRPGLEEKSARILGQARKEEVGILVGGDALFATTHLSLILECRKQGIPYEIVHAPGIFPTVGECGLSLYKFGAVVTVPFPQKGFDPAGYYETILRNREAGLHTLILLDRGMSVREGVALLGRLDRKGVFRKLVCISQAGPGQVIRYGDPGQFDDPAPAVLILPGALNAFEEEFLTTLQRP